MLVLKRSDITTVIFHRFTSIRECNALSIYKYYSTVLIISFRFLHMVRMYVRSYSDIHELRYTDLIAS